MTLLEHAAQAGLGQTKHGRQIDRQRLLPVLALHAQNQRITCNAGVVDQNRRQAFGRRQRIEQVRRSRPRSVAFQTRPRPRMPAARRSAPNLSAPSAVVAVPTTVAPAPPSASAIARPMPREAPVTSARSDSSTPGSSGGGRGGGRHGGRERVGILERIAVRAALDAPVQAGQHLARDRTRSGLAPARAARARWLSSAPDWRAAAPAWHGCRPDPNARGRPRR